MKFGDHRLYKWDRVFKSGPSKICRRPPLKNLKRYVPLKQTISSQIFLKAVFDKFYLFHSWILGLKYILMKNQASRNDIRDVALLNYNLWIHTCSKSSMQTRGNRLWTLFSVLAVDFEHVFVWIKMNRL